MYKKVIAGTIPGPGNVHLNSVDMITGTRIGVNSNFSLVLPGWTSTWWSPAGGGAKWLKRFDNNIKDENNFPLVNNVNNCNAKCNIWYVNSHMFRVNSEGVFAILSLIHDASIQSTDFLLCSVITTSLCMLINFMILIFNGRTFLF